jgi:hypothetical protein
MHEIIQRAKKHVKDLYDIEVDCPSIVFDNQGLYFFEGGCTWIHEDGRASIQIRKDKLFFYKKEEILAHELVHFFRKDLSETIFEEIIAYETSNSKFRRYFGPLFRSSFECFIALLSLMLPFFSLPLIFFTFFTLLFFLIRNVYRQSQWRKAKKKCLKKHLIQLRDIDIINLSKN